VLTFARAISIPPTVIGYVDVPFLTVDDRRPADVWCPIHAPTSVWPSAARPLYAGDVLPLHHNCVECGLDINELDPRRRPEPAR
jgi:hypothetical protein